MEVVRSRAVCKWSIWLTLLLMSTSFAFTYLGAQEDGSEKKSGKNPAKAQLPKYEKSERVTIYSLIGLWQLVDVIVDGERPVAKQDIDNHRIVFSDDRYFKYNVDDNGIYKSHGAIEPADGYKLSTQRNPTGLDLYFIEGGERLMTPWIVEFRDGDMIMGTHGHGKERPKKFDEEGISIRIYRRIEKQKSD